MVGDGACSKPHHPGLTQVTFDGNSKIFKEKPAVYQKMLLN